MDLESEEMIAFWKNKKVLLTGHTGYKGTWMALMLEYLGAKVYGYSLPIEKETFYGKVVPQIEQEWANDIADSTKVMEVIQTIKPEIIIHLASHSSLEGSQEIPEYILRTNLMGPINILEGVRKTLEVKAVVIVTSDKCYFNQDKNIKYTEAERLWATDPYSASKVGQELITGCYIDTFFRGTKRNVGVGTARASNVIGPGDDNLTRLLPYVFNCYMKGLRPQIRNPKTIRPWQYVLDVLRGYLLLAEKLYNTVDCGNLYCGAYNFGPNDDGFVTVEEIVKMISWYFDEMPYDVISGEGHIRHEAQILMLDSTKAKDLLKWIPKRSLQQAIKDTIYVIKKQEKIELAEISRELIRDYFEGKL